MAKIGSLTADLKLESAAFIRDMRRAAQETARSTTAMQRSMAGIGKSFAAAGAALKTFVLGFVGLKSIQGLAAIVKMADDVGDTAARLGVGAEELQRFRLAGEQAGVAVTEMDTALKLFQKNLASGQIKAEGASIAESFGNVFEQIRNAPTLSEEIAIATKAAGKQFTVLLGLSRMGKEEFEAWARSAAVFSKDALQAADDLDKQWRSFTNALLVPFGTGFLEGMVGGVKLTEEELKKLQETAIGVGRAIGDAIKNFIRDVRGFIQLGRDVATEFQTTAARNATEMRLAAQRSRRFAQGVPQGIPTVPLVNPEIPEINVSELEKPLGEAAKTTAELAAEQRAAKESFDAMVHSWEVGTDVVVNELSPGLKTLHESLQNVGEMAASSFAEAVVEGKNFSEVLDQLAKDIAKMIIQMLLMQAIKQAIDAGFSGATGVPTANFHTGGIVGRDGRGGRSLPSSMFLGAPRFHNGLMPGEFPAILKKDEGVFTPEQMKALGRGGEVNINIENRNGSEVTASGERDNDGNVNIEIVIDQVVGRKLLQPGAASNRAMKQGFGAQPVGIRR